VKKFSLEAKTCSLLLLQRRGNSRVRAEESNETTMADKIKTTAAYDADSIQVLE
jgi:hypothetical protein